MSFLDTLVLKYGTKTMKIQALKNIINDEVKAHVITANRIKKMQRLLAKLEDKKVDGFV